MTRHIDTLIIHCSATRPNQDITATDIDRWHRQRGWWGCGYHVVIPRDGRIQTAANGDRCRPMEQAGAHVGDCGPGWNKRSIGICMAGGIDAQGKPENNFTEAQWKSLEEVVLTMLERYPTINQIGGHRDLIAATKAPPKACPCFDVKTWFDRVRLKHPDAQYLSGVRYI